ncbi:MAG: YhcH/YjgK/YiaL family protein [Phycisphaerae bacterium]
MIIDGVENLRLYAALHPNLARTAAFLRSVDLAALPEGRIEIADDDAFALVQSYESKPLVAGKWEAHLKYADVQIVVSGVEQIGYGRLSDMRVTEPYDADRDVGFFDGAGQFARVDAGMFMILLPHDVHMPQIAVGEPGMVRKIVCKVAWDGRSAK